jgi:type I restriction enzyme M protein
MDLLQVQNKDLATGKKINAEKPEEKVRQEYEQILRDDYEYDFGQMDIEVYIQRGEVHGKKNRERADIVIYKTTDANKRDQNLDILGIVETKKPTKKEGVRQLKSYMSATSCKWGVWTNGEEIEYLYRDLKTGEIKDNYVYQIPKNGETFEDIGKVSKQNLKPASNLKAVFRRLLATLYANTNISRREKLGNEMIRLIFCKILDEKYDPNALPKFRVGFEENYHEVAKRVHELFEEVKKELGDDDVFDKHDKIILDDKSIAKVVGELEQYSLLKTNKDVVGDAFEVFAESKLVGEKGEFFTPREVVKTAVQIVNPQPGDTIMDPACGSGGFLIYSLEHIWEQMDSGSIRKYNGMSEVDLAQAKSKVAAETFFGIDKEMDLVKISKAYMAIIGDGRSKIAQQNTLHTAEEFEGKARDIFVDDSGENFKKFDIVLSNPPFGNKIKVLKEDSKHFQLGHIWKKDDSGFTETDKVRETEPQVLFIERCLQLLKDGGKLAIIIPETYFHAPKVKYVLDYMRKGNNFVALIDLAHNTFRPYNNAKTILLILEKGRPQQENIVMAVAEQIGHDHNGQPMFRYDPETHKFSDEIWDDTVTIREELKDPGNLNNKNTFIVKASDIKNDVYVPRYYWNQRVEGLRREAESQGLQFVQVKTLIDEGILTDYSGHGSPASVYKGKGAVPYVRVADIVNWAIYKNPTALVPESVYRNIKGNGVDLKEEDVLFVRRGSYRIGSVAMVSPYDKDVLLTREIQVLRVLNPENKYNIDAYYLLYLLSHEITQKQLSDKVMIDTTLPNIGRRWEDLYLPVSTDPAVRKAIAESVKAAIQNRWDSQKGIFDLATKFGQIIT